MTPREPDRFDKQALDIYRFLFPGMECLTHVGHLCGICRDRIAAALRAAESSALERALAEVPRNQPDTRDRIRALIPPAAAPAAEALCAKCGKVEDSSEHHDGLHGTASAHEFEHAPAADYDPITAPIPEGDMNGPHGPPPAAETGKAQGALDELAAVLRGKDEMGERLAKALGVPAEPLSRLVDAAIARIGELEKALGCLERAATAHANEHGCSGNLAARLSDARALLPPLAARAAPPEREGNR